MQVSEKSGWQQSNDMIEKIQGEIEKYISKKNIYFHKFSDELQAYLKKQYPDLPTIKSQWYMLKNSLSVIPKCELPNCDISAKWNERNNQFDAGCCADHNKRLTSLKNFGTEHPNQSKKQQRKVKKLIREKYGVDYITQTTLHKDSVRDSVVEKYGVENVLRSPEVREKIKQTNLERYGVEHPTENPEIRAKVKLTNIKRYGVSESLASPEIRAKGNKTNIERYGSIFPMRNEELLEKRRNYIINKYDVYGVAGIKDVADKVRKTKFNRYYTKKLLNNQFVMPMFSVEDYNGSYGCYEYNWKCKKCGTFFSGRLSSGLTMLRCPTCFPKEYSVSRSESELFESINVSNKIQTNRDLIDGFEIDIFLPDFKIGIEYNGMYWHSEQKGITKYYHLDKTIASENEKLFLIHIFEIEWKNKPIQTISMIERYIGIFNEIIPIETLVVKSVEDTIFDEFVRGNSLEMTDGMFERRIGAYRGEELLAAMAIVHSKNGVVITKFIEKNGIGFKGNIFLLLLERLSLRNQDIYYYPDRRYHSPIDSRLLNSGFTFEGGTEPNLLFNKGNLLLPAHKISKKNIESYVGEYDSGLTLYENMIFNGYLSLWDCGRLVFKKSK